MRKIFLLMTAALASVTVMAQKAQVWDFGAQVLDTAKYVNMLSVDEINSWYPATVTPGSNNQTIADFTASDGVNLKFVAGGKSNHRIRTTNEAITRYDNKSLKDKDENVYSGYIYSNYTSTNTVYIEQVYEANDKVEFYVGSNGNPAVYEVLDPDGKTTPFEYTKAAQIEKITFYAGATGAHKIYCTNEKLVVARIVRTPAAYAEVSGTINAPATIPAGYSILFTNLQNGSVVEATPQESAYETQLAIGYDYEVSLKNANGFVVSSATPISIEGAMRAYNVTIESVELVTVTGAVVGLPAEQLQKVEIVFALPEGKIYVPELTIDVENATYSAVLEKNVKYGITALNINDYVMGWDSVYAPFDLSNQNIPFSLKPRYAVTIVPTGASAADLANAKFIFTRLDDEYVYEFTGTEGIELRDGVYTVKTANTGAFVQLLTANLRVNGEPVSKQIDFTADIHEWNFSDADFVNGGYSSTSAEYTYKTLLFTGCRSHNSTYLYAGNEALIFVPVKGNSIITVNACYEYHLQIGDSVIGDAQTGSTSQIDALTYEYEGAAGFVTISAFGTCYINSISVEQVAEYQPVVTVGAGKDYLTINEALAAIARMTRADSQYVTVLIEPGNYEEMLRIHLDNITFKNASATPSIALKDGGVNIDENAVRITSYYGHGYNYYSMNADYAWDARTLAVNKENGYASVVNAGGASTTHWNSTVVVYGKNFSAEGIIFENSYNQYISQKESEDVVEAIDKLPARPTDAGNTAVQARNYRERACALAFAKGSDRGYLKDCRVVSRQDALYGDNGVRVAIEGGILNGACDYIFGGMTLAVKHAELAMLVTSDNNDVAYLTASKTDANVRGYLFYGCSVTSAKPGIDMVETVSAKPGYFGRPWATTAETVFYLTNVGKKDNASLIAAEGWNNGLQASGAVRSYEYRTIEEAKVNNYGKRVNWATVLHSKNLPDNTEITLFNFTKGSDNWQPLMDEDEPATVTYKLELVVNDSAMGAVAVTNLIGSDIVENEDGSYTVPEYQEVSILATPNEGFDFKGWSEGNVGSVASCGSCWLAANTESNPLVLYMAEDMALMATFEAKPEGIESISDCGCKTEKIIRDGQVVIVRDGKEYNVLGTEIR